MPLKLEEGVVVVVIEAIRSARKWPLARKWQVDENRRRGRRRREERGEGMVEYEGGVRRRGEIRLEGVIRLGKVAAVESLGLGSGVVEKGGGLWLSERSCSSYSSSRWC